MYPIQVFWFAAVLAAERIAIWPVLLICLVDKDIACIWCYISIITHDLDSLRHRLFQCRCDSIGIISRNDDGADMLLGEGCNERHLCSGICRGRANLLELSIQGRSSQFAPRGCSIKIRIVDLLGQESDSQRTASGARSAARRGATSTSTAGGERENGENDESKT